ncbi:MAG: prolyl oligopeptidase family serine peptidase [Planctomycetaceae bacterium]
MNVLGRSLLCPLICLILFFIAGLAPAAEPTPGKQVAAQLQGDVKVELQYLLYLPEDYEKQEKWPLLVFLHGSGERGDDLDKVAVHGPPKLIKGGKQFPFIVVSPQCPAQQRWQALSLEKLIDDVSKTYKVDTDRIYITGLSMGGFGTWGLAAHAPQKFAAIVPICGGGETYWAKEIAHIPCWVFHGEKDGAVPFKRSQDMVDALKKAGGEPKFTAYPEAGHDSWTESYNNPALYEWLLEQKRPAKK